jgi:cation diffusion facilitator family transporter
MADVLTSLAVVVGLVLVLLTGWSALDALVALVVGLHITGIGVMLVKRSFVGLMDHALTGDDQVRLREAIASALPHGCTFHHLRTRLAGRRKFADFHLLVPGGLSVREAHAIAHEVEDQVRTAVPDLELTIHVEPIEEQSSWEPDRLARLGEPTDPPQS